MILRPERPEDITVIERITRDAFKGKPYRDETEDLNINRLREAQALALSQVAEPSGRAVGLAEFHKAFYAPTYP
jgi:putative acetyltransferase